MVCHKEINNFENIMILTDNHFKNLLNNLVIIKMKMKEKTLRIKELIRFIKSVEVVNQTICKVRQSTVKNYTIDDY